MAITQELFPLCSCVGIPKDIITNQGTRFVSRLVADLCKLLCRKHLPTSVYHPQTARLSMDFQQRFNGAKNSFLPNARNLQRTKEWDDTALQNPLSLKKGPDAM
ncbi:hypothetical protein MHYP_G00099970 [Metynnis hypsauchen]